MDLKMVSPIIKQSWAVSAVLLNMLGQGMVLSYSSSLVPALRAADSAIKTDLETISWLSSCIGLACLPGFIISSWLMDTFGRKIAHGLVIIPGTLGWLLIYYATNVPTLLIGRILGGVTGGATVTLGAVVIGEYTSPKHRGMFLNLKTASVCLGNTVVHIIGNYWDYKTVAICAILPHLIAIVIICTWPESPAWLAARKEFHKSEKSFYWLRGKTDESSRELDELFRSQMDKGISLHEKLEETKMKVIRNSFSNFFKKFTRKDFLKPIVIIFFAGLLLEACGRHIFPAYALDMIGSITGNENKSHAFYYTLCIDLITTISASMSSILVRLLKRRTLLFSTGFAALVVLFSVCIYLFLQSKGIIPKGYTLIPISLLAIYFILANLGCTPIPLALLGEVWPLAHRGAGSAVSGLILSLCLMIAMKITPSMLVTIHFYGTFAVYGSITGLSFMCLYFLLPETKDKTLQQIEDYFNYGRFIDEDKNDKIDDAKMKMITDT